MELTKAQELVINTNNKSLLVSASAGSGKTFVVVERIVESIKQGKDISNMLILTFTNAAASELKERIVNKLYDIKEEYLKEGKKEEAKRISKQISLVPSSDVSTIHAFCLSVIRNNFYMLGIDPNVVTLDQNKAVIMLEQAIMDVIDKNYENASEEFLDILDMVGSEERLVETLYELYQAYVKNANKNKWLENAVSTYNIDITKITDLTKTEFGNLLFSNIKDILELQKIELEKIIDKLDGIDDFATRRDVFKVMLDRIKEAIAIDTLDKLYSYMEIVQDIPRMPNTKVVDEELKKEVTSIKKKITDEIKKISATLLYKDTKGIVEELNSTFKYAVWYKQAILDVEQRYTEEKLKLGSIDFADYEILTLQALKNDSVREKYKEKYTDIYIDEYQDTSDIQEAILMQIAKENNVIMVGDVKQSIYGFRNAAPELFSSKYERLQRVEDIKEEDIQEAKIVLAQNFRSRKEVIDSTNEVFSKLMNLEFGGAKYGDKERLVLGAAYPLEDEDKKTELHIIEKESIEQTNSEKASGDIIEEYTSLELEALAIGEKIKELTNGEFKVYDVKKQEYRKCEYKDIVILIRTVENKANVIQNTLSEMDIPCYADSKTGFYKSDEISLIISFLKVLDNPFYDIPLVSVMYSIIGKFTLDDLVKIRKLSTQTTYFEAVKLASTKLEDKQLKEKVVDFLELLNRFKRYLKTYSLTNLVIKLYDETGIYEAMRFEKLGKLKCTNLDSFIQIISEYEKDENVIKLHSLLKYLDVLKTKESGGDSPKLLGENENVVRIMTMHKSKGLEFPVVILANTAQKYNERDLTDKIVTDSKLGIGLDIYNKELNLTYPSVIKQVIKSKMKKESRSEALRLLYVAFTRAKEKLIIYGTVPSTLEKYTKDMYFVENQVSQVLAYTNNCHLKCILQAIYGNEQNIIVNVHSDIQNNIDYEKQNISRNEDSISKFIQLVNENEIKENEEIISKKQEKLIIKYAYDINIKQKYTVTELAKKESTVDIESIQPICISNNVTGTSYGTFIHSIIENINYKYVSKEHIQDVVKTQINVFNLNGKININKTVDKILKLYTNHLKEFVQDAKMIKNELEFVILDSIDKDNAQDKTLLQGVIDMYIETSSGKGILIDFKTDNLETEEEFINRYKEQLNIYKRAIQVIYNKQVEKTYIYSFKLDKMIEVKN